MSTSRKPVQTVVENRAGLSFHKLVIYNLMFFVPVLFSLIFLTKIGQRTADYFQSSPQIIAKVLLIPVITVIFFLVIPYIRKREDVSGIRHSIFAFLLVAAILSLLSVVSNRDISMLFVMMIYAGIYILVTFFLCPEVLGMEKNMIDWFRHRKQMNIIIIYLSIILLIIIGFGGLYHAIHSDLSYDGAFRFLQSETATTSTFMYYSMVTFTTTGYGDILPVAPIARLCFFFEALIGLMLNVLFIAILLLFISSGQVAGRSECACEHSNKVESKKKDTR